MQRLDLTLATPAENVALDEALLTAAEESATEVGLLRLWEADSPFVVLGRASQAGREVNREACRNRGVPVLRRASGGATVVAGPGCLMYAVILPYEGNPQLRQLDLCHQFVMTKLRSAATAAISPLESPQIDLQGICDLTLAGRKFSGNSLRCRRTHFLYHGTVLYDYDLTLIGDLLGTPTRMPDYRENRDHADFVTNFPSTAAKLRDAIIHAWDATEPVTDWPQAEVQRLVQEKYTQDAWTWSR
ncbi:MAG: lipoate--protein ligase family protein [Pirellulaceae bacterium]